jgi:hypothetical protein
MWAEVAKRYNGPAYLKNRYDVKLATAAREWDRRLVGLPVSSAVGFAEQHDVLRAEVISWREWYRRLREAWPKP